MGYYPRDFLEQLCLTSDIVSLISEDTALKGKGDRFTGLCPFPEHNEKTPSFSVSAGKQLYHCFGCQNSGNIFTYLKKQRGMSFSSAVEYLAEKKGIPIPKIHKTKTERISPGLFELSEKICSFFERQLMQTSKDHKVRSYLKKRGYSSDLIQGFRMGYAPKGNVLLSFLRDPKEQRQAMELGLINRSNAGDIYDNFRHRLIFPILSVQKQVIGFGARVLDDSFPKYINSKESKIFHKGQSFYGINESARYLRQDSFALIVEGYTDFLSLWQAGFKNLVATLGTALTEHHARLLKQYVETVVMVFDGDQAGARARERSLPLLLGAGLKVKFISLPQGQDPDDFIRSKGHQAFQRELRLSKDLFFFTLKKRQEELKAKGRDPLHLVEELSPLLAVVGNKALQIIYRQRLLDLFGSDSRLVENLLNERIKKQPEKTHIKKNVLEEEPRPSPAFSLNQALESERLLLVLCLESEIFLNSFLSEGLISLLRTEGMLKIFNKIVEYYRQKPNHFDKLIHLVMNEVIDTHLIFKSSYPVFKEVGREDQKKIFEDSINFLRKKQKHSEASALLARMKMDRREDVHDLEKVFQLTKQRLAQKNQHKT